MSIEPGMSLGRYTILGIVGRGGMASVYKAHHAALDRTVALKVMRASLTEDPEFVERFRREARAIARLEHPNIVQVFDFDEIDGRSVLAMQYLEGGTLKDLIVGRDAPMSMQESAQVVRGIADALDHAHGSDIIHRDVKPSNVMLTKGGRVVVTDFGIAKIVGSSSTQYTATGVGVGTPDYMSPEQGQGVPLDRRSDIYALGAVAYELLTGKVPFSAETPMAVMIKHIRDPLPPPSAFNPAITPAVESVIARAMAKLPADRYATAGEFATALEQAVRDPTRAAPIVGAPATTTPPPPIAVPRNVLIGGIVAVALLLLGGGALVASRIGSEPPTPAAATQRALGPGTASSAGAVGAPPLSAPPLGAPPPRAPASAEAPVVDRGVCTPSAGPSGTSFTCTFSDLPPGAAVTLTGRVGGSTSDMNIPGQVVDATGTYRTPSINSRGMPAGIATFTATAAGVSRTAQFEAQ